MKLHPGHLLWMWKIRENELVLIPTIGHNINLTVLWRSDHWSQLVTQRALSFKWNDSARATLTRFTFQYVDEGQSPLKGSLLPPRWEERAPRARDVTKLCPSRASLHEPGPSQEAWRCNDDGGMMQVQLWEAASLLLPGQIFLGLKPVWLSLHQLPHHKGTARFGEGSGEDAGRGQSTAAPSPTSFSNSSQLCAARGESCWARTLNGLSLLVGSSLFGRAEPTGRHCSPAHIMSPFSAERHSSTQKTHAHASPRAQASSPHLLLCSAGFQLTKLYSHVTLLWASEGFKG